MFSINKNKMGESENIFSTRHLPVVNERVKQLVDFYANGSVKRFSEMIHLSSSQKLNRVFNLDKRNNEYPEVSSDILLSIANMFADINTEWLLTGRGEMTKTSQPTPTEHIQTSCVSKNKDKEKFDGNQGLSPEIFDKLLSTIKEQQITIKEQAEEIGVLKQMIVQLKQDKSGRVSDASDSTVANAV
jgi:hypothetical protein